MMNTQRISVILTLMQLKDRGRLHNAKINGASRMPSILLVGDYSWPWYQEACAKALEALGCRVYRFGWFDDFRHWIQGHPEPVYHSFWHRTQYRLQMGPAVWRVDKRLLKIAGKLSVDVVWFYNVQLVSFSTLKRLRRMLPNALFCQYANDNPFSKSAKPGLWRNYLASIPLFDIHFSYRHDNIEDYIRYGAKQVYLLRSYFVPDMDYPVPQADIPDPYKCDVVFAGHYEDDGRAEILEALIDGGHKLNLFGGGWDEALHNLRSNSPLRKLLPIQPVTGPAYRYAICGGKVALCFLSTLNQDTYTRRNFQIPAMKTAMLSQYTHDLAKLYVPDREAVFFGKKTELLQKLSTLLEDDNRQRSIAAAGYDKVWGAGHDVKSRMQEWLGNVLRAMGLT